MPTTPLLSMFRRSPLTPVQDHMAKVDECSQKLLQFCQAAFTEHWEVAAHTRNDIIALEHEADKLLREVRMTLPKGLFLPVERSDLLGLIKTQDKIANKARDITGIIYGRQLIFPESIQQQYLAFLSCSLKATTQARKTIHELDDLLESGFTKHESTLVERMISTLDDIESEADQLEVAVRRDLFDIESTLPPVQTIFMYKVIEMTGDLADRSLEVGSKLEILLAR